MVPRSLFWGDGCRGESSTYLLELMEVRLFPREVSLSPFSPPSPCLIFISQN